MRIQVKKKGNRTAILVSFDTANKKFKSPSEKSRFFEELYGRDQVIKKNQKIYRYRREGLMDDMPHIKVDSSVFIIALEQMRKMEEFMNEWEKKVVFKTFDVMLKEEEADQLESAEPEQFQLLEIPKKKKVI